MKYIWLFLSNDHFYDFTISDVIVHYLAKGKQFVFFLTGKGKRWKNLYFILEGSDAQLIYFESEKRATKPKGLIDLSVCSVYVVHESLFGR